MTGSSFRLKLSHMKHENVNKTKYFKNNFYLLNENVVHLQRYARLLWTLLNIKMNTKNTRYLVFNAFCSGYINHNLLNQ